MTVKITNLLAAALELVPAPHNPDYSWELHGNQIQLRGPEKNYDQGIAGWFQCRSHRRDYGVVVMSSYAAAST